jgi:hypothetical protein
VWFWLRVSNRQQTFKNKKKSNIVVGGSHTSLAQEWLCV